MSQLPGVGSHTHEFVSEFTKSLACYTINLGSDLSKIPGTINNFLHRPENFPGHSSNIVENNKSPLISVIIPVFNGENFIQKAIDNILGQNYPAIEIIMVDDGSTDDSKKIITELEIDVRYFYQPNNGPASARNRAIKDVSGEYIAFLDVDDLWPENNLKLLLKELEQDKNLLVVRGHAQVFKTDENGNMEFLGNPDESFPNYIGAGLYRKKAFNKVGLLDPELTFGEDDDWYKRALELSTNIKRLDEVTLLVRRHGGNMTEGKSLLELNALKVFKKALDRERKSVIKNVKQ
jgi:glycosyltransferase involved in cell wall biosynthesis